jgi:hypothetical protein
MKRILLMILVCTLFMTAVSCTKTKDVEDGKMNNNNGYAGDFAKPQDSAQSVSEGNFIDVSQVDAQYIRVEKGIVYIDAKAPCFTIGGIEHPNDNEGEWYRLDASKKEIYTSENAYLAQHLSGGTVRFRTNADSFVLKAQIRVKKEYTTLPHFTDRGAFGFDVYTGTGTNRIYCGANMQMMTNNRSLEETIALPGGYQEVTINLPLYAGVSSLEIGLPEGSMITTATARNYDAPICFYGSSITQGGCVSRPGISYSNIICRMLNADNMNLGFSGSGRGEQSVAKYIASRDIAAFVMDYDHNADSPQSLANTHYAFYKTVRDAHPDIPIIMVTRPVYATQSTEDQLARQEVIRASYERAVAEGDKNVYFVSGYDFFMKEMPDLYSVDYTHPNDLGHYYMAKTIFPVLQEALK